MSPIRMTSNEGIQTADTKTCLFCDIQGAPLHGGLRDRLFGAPGLWGVLQCPACGLVWLNPHPCPEENAKLYSGYYTHGEEEKRPRLARLRDKVEAAILACSPHRRAFAPTWGWRRIGWALSLIPPLREMASMRMMCLDKVKPGKILDVGCGSGRFLSIMKAAGWDVAGVENDPAAAKIARERYDIPVVAGTLEEAGVADGLFDCVTLSHVIEHVRDPVGLLRECHRVLKSKGLLVVTTPNIASLGHTKFRQNWLHLDPPRHFFLFSPKTLGAVAKHSRFQTVQVRTSSRNAVLTWVASRAITRKGTFSYSDISLTSALGGCLFHMREEISRLGDQSAGEELVMTACKDA